MSFWFFVSPLEIVNSVFAWCWHVLKLCSNHFLHIQWTGQHKYMWLIGFSSDDFHCVPCSTIDSRTHLQLDQCSGLIFYYQCNLHNYPVNTQSSKDHRTKQNSKMWRKHVIAAPLTYWSCIYTDELGTDSTEVHFWDEAHKMLKTLPFQWLASCCKYCMLLRETLWGSFFVHAF